MDRAQGAAGDAKIKESLPLEEFCLVVKEVNNEGTLAPYIANIPAGWICMGLGIQSKDWDLGRTGKWQGSLLGRAV